MTRYFAFGDLHGHYRELMALYERLLTSGLEPARDVVVFIGDHIDTGPDSRRVVTQLMAWQRLYPHWVFLCGNHEDLMLNARKAWDRHDEDGFATWWLQGGEETWRSYLLPGQPDPAPDANPFDLIDPAHVAWLEGLALYHETEHFIFVHAGLRPGRRPEETAREDLLWIRDEFILSEFDWGQRVVYGHTPTREPLVLPNKIGLDTLPRSTGKLTVVALDDEHPEAPPGFMYQRAF
jgi:serine/threonine protein phosphatase 1